MHFSCLTGYKQTQQNSLYLAAFLLSLSPYSFMHVNRFDFRVIFSEPVCYITRSVLVYFAH